MMSERPDIIPVILLLMPIFKPVGGMCEETVLEIQVLQTTKLVFA